MDKNQVMLDYLTQCPAVKSYLHFNTVTERPGQITVETVSGEEWEKRYLGGHGVKLYDFAVVQMAPQDDGTNRNNADQMRGVQEFMDWIKSQNRSRKFPEFEGCKVLSIQNLQNMPNLAGVDAAGKAAKYMFQCRVRYYE